MKLFYLILLMVASMSLQCSCYIVQEQVPCENVRSLRWAQIDFLDTCFINDATISSPDVSCSEPRNVSVKGLSLCQNKNINYLPVKIARSFPNLLGYCAAECNIKAISKENFRKLVHLVELLLLRNKIEVILRDTFEDLTSLERIDLRQNMISRVNSEAFKNLKSLRTISMFDNRCIQKNFQMNYLVRSNISVVAQEIGQNCSFKEIKPANIQNFFSEQCGGVNFLRNKVTNGVRVVAIDEFPFLVALFEKKGNESKFFCGATLITNQHLITAAHCLHPKFQKAKLTQNLEAYVGSLNLNTSSRDLSEKIDVWKIIFHPRWNSLSPNYDADLAIIFLSEEVTFSRSVQPICLPTEQTTFVSGTVVGWGETNNNSVNLEYPFKAEVNVIDVIDCIISYPSFAYVAFKKAICGSGDDFAGPSRGDSGGGFYVFKHGVWNLAGVVSISLSSHSNEHNSTIPTLYTKIIDYKPWIKDTVNRKSR